MLDIEQARRQRGAQAHIQMQPAIGAQAQMQAFSGANGEVGAAVSDQNLQHEQGQWPGAQLGSNHDYGGTIGASHSATASNHFVSHATSRHMTMPMMQAGNGGGSMNYSPHFDRYDSGSASKQSRGAGAAVLFQWRRALRAGLIWLIRFAQVRKHAYMSVLLFIGLFLFLNDFFAKWETSARALQLLNVEVHVGSSAVLPGSSVRLLESATSASCPAALQQGAQLNLAESAQSSKMPGWSIVAACQNKIGRVPLVVKNWMLIEGVSEIVLVDWGSSEHLAGVLQRSSVPLGHANATSPCVRVVRVDAEDSWVLSRAYNLAASLARYENLLRLDCDHVASEKILHAHPLSTSTFYTGDWSSARNPNEVHLNGAMIVRLADFAAIGGYDERIQTYGWDDEELYGRLRAKRKLERKTFNYDLIAHLPHGDSDRGQKGIRFVQAEVDLNRILLDKLPSWGANIAHMSVYQADANGALVATQRAPSLFSLVDSKERDAAWLTALGRRLHDEFHVPWDLLESMDFVARERLLSRLAALAQEMQSGRSDGLTLAKPPKVLIAHVQHGLGNRLRALGSAMSFAAVSGRALIVLWENDLHCGANFEELFEIDSVPDIVVISKIKLSWPFLGVEKWDSAWSSVARYNYMEVEGSGALKGEKILDLKDKHIYVKSAYVIETDDSRLTSWELDNVNLRRLVPVASVRAIVQTFEDKGLHDMVGVHIRERRLSEDIKQVRDAAQEYGASASSMMDKWRLAADHVNFVEHMREIQSREPSVHFFVAADRPSTMDDVSMLFPDAIFHYDITVHEQHSGALSCDERTRACVLAALVDLVCLSRTKRILGSNWSSFTEAAMRLSGKRAELAGVDFGPKVS
ncbi:hypothetical protein FVE85_0808 [Porphyridium purpureum]|uniref:Uncharacterized protein n=1 Tax=Porphyridium purpureum TaxID=35688 RepID=A0A5J4YZK4_PORPP|nr:hypothetical protein FVE85_0808 [Porphyridium purpureum]|eukprot:POR1480..scf208_2